MHGRFDEFNTIFRQISCIVLTSYFLHLVKWIISGTTFSLQVQHYQSSCCRKKNLDGAVRLASVACHVWYLWFLSPFLQDSNMRGSYGCLFGYSVVFSILWVTGMI